MTHPAAMAPDFDDRLHAIEDRWLDPPDEDRIPDPDNRFYTKADYEYEKEMDL
jgi:hypothetical protein